MDTHQTASLSTLVRLNHDVEKELLKEPSNITASVTNMTAASSPPTTPQLTTFSPIAIPSLPTLLPASPPPSTRPPSPPVQLAKAPAAAPTSILVSPSTSMPLLQPTSQPASVPIAQSTSAPTSQVGQPPQAAPPPIALPAAPPAPKEKRAKQRRDRGLSFVDGTPIGPETCIECLMRDRDLADVSVEHWDRESDADFRAAVEAENAEIAREEHEWQLRYDDALLRGIEAPPAPEKRKRRLERGQRLMTNSLKFWTSINPPSSSHRWKTLQTYLREQYTYLPQYAAGVAPPIEPLHDPWDDWEPPMSRRLSAASLRAVRRSSNSLRRKSGGALAKRATIDATPVPSSPSKSSRATWSSGVPGESIVAAPADDVFSSPTVAPVAVSTPTPTPDPTPAPTAPPPMLPPPPSMNQRRRSSWFKMFREKTKSVSASMLDMHLANDTRDAPPTPGTHTESPGIGFFSNVSQPNLLMTRDSFNTSQPSLLTQQARASRRSQNVAPKSPYYAQSEFAQTPSQSYYQHYPNPSEVALPTASQSMAQLQQYPVPEPQQPKASPKKKGLKSFLGRLRLAKDRTTSNSSTRDAHSQQNYYARAETASTQLAPPPRMSLLARESIAVGSPAAEEELRQAGGHASPEPSNVPSSPKPFSVIGTRRASHANSIVSSKFRSEKSLPQLPTEVHHSSPTYDTYTPSIHESYSQPGLRSFSEVQTHTKGYPEALSYPKAYPELTYSGDMPPPNRSSTNMSGQPLSPVYVTANGTGTPSVSTGTRGHRFSSASNTLYSSSNNLSLSPRVQAPTQANASAFSLVSPSQSHYPLPTNSQSTPHSAMYSHSNKTSESLSRDKKRRSTKIWTHIKSWRNSNADTPGQSQQPFTPDVPPTIVVPGDGHANYVL